MVSRPNITVRAIIQYEGKLFLQQLKNGDGKNSWWCTAGGKLDEGEDLISGLRREIVEETGVEPVIGRLLFIQQFIDDNGTEWMDFFFHVENAAHYQTIDLETTTHGVLEVAEYGFVDPKKVTVLPKGLSEIDITTHISENRPVQLMNYL